MPRLILLGSVLACAHAALLSIHPSGVAGEVGAGPRVGVVLDVGGLGDRSFNDASYAGAQRAIRELGARVRFIEPSETSDREAGLRLFAAEGLDLVVGVGFVFTDDLLALAREYPEVRFAGVDFSARPGQVLPGNLMGIRFREEEGAFLVGALAGLTTRSRVVGFVGGMDVPLIHRFENGFQAGALQVCPGCRVLQGYAGITPDAFRNPVRGKELALSEYQEGADILFHAAGSTGLGVFEAARETGKLAIGVDSDQWDAAPGHVLTSMVKRVDAVVFDAIAQVQAGTFHGGPRDYGLAEGGVGWVYDVHNRELVSEATAAKVEALRQAIVSGTLTVAANR